MYLSQSYQIIYVSSIFYIGMCEALWFPDMNPEQLFESISQALMNAVDRDASAGWGGIVHVIEPHQITTKKLKARMDWTNGRLYVIKLWNTYLNVIACRYPSLYCILRQGMIKFISG